MSDEFSKIYENDTNEGRPHWFSQNMFRLMMFLSFVWCVIIIVYITKFFGWNNLFLMMPDEFGIFLAGISLPLPIMWLVISFIDREQNFKQEAKFLRSYMQQLVYPESGSAETAKALGSAIQQQVRELQETAKLATQKTEMIKSELGAKLDEFANILQVLDNYSSKNIAELSSAVKSLMLSFDQVSSKAYQATKDFNQCSTDFSKIGEYFQERVNSIVEKLSPTVHDIKDSINTIQNISEQSLPKVLQDTHQTAEFFAKTLNLATKKVEENSLSSQERIISLTQDLQKLGEQMENVSAQSAQYFEKTGDKLRAVIIEMTANAERILTNIHNSGTVFLQQSADLTSATDNTLNHVSSAILEISSSLNNFNAQSSDIISNSKNFNAALQQQIEMLTLQAEKANQEFVALEEKYRNAKVDTFLKDAAVIISKLNNLSVDLNAVLNSDNQEKLWKRYYEGDTNIFIRTLTKSINREQALKIKQEYEQNQEFRSMVNNYMQEFESLVNQARACEKSNILLSLISGGDIGKIYYIMASVLDKLN
ncbi:MAG: methyl-accepting chemotaxis protein [Alphaproteobacteria bacterium]|nr:methyl-accepting chemotaxis protein [Alphaproteobacteria bacterium]